MKRLWRMTFLFSFWFYTQPIHAQLFEREGLGCKIGFSYTFGYPLNSLGIQYKLYYLHSFFQVNLGGKLDLVATDLASRRKFVNFRQYLGAIGLFGNRGTSQTYIFDGLFHQSDRNYGLGYNYIWYIDNVGTSQQSGGMSVHIQRASILLENDFFAGQGRDRFRTNDLLIGYRLGDWYAFVQSKLWTGETRSAPRKEHTRIKNNAGYKDLRDMPFGKKTHGILAAGIIGEIPYHNALVASLGWDSEIIRHLLQNKLMHDKQFIPNKFRKQNPNYPILNQEGLPVFDLNNRKKDQVYFKLGLNTNWSY